MALTMSLLTPTAFAFVMLLVASAAEAQPFAPVVVPLEKDAPLLFSRPQVKFDLDGDGKSDLLWRNESTGRIYAMLMNGPAIASEGTVYLEPNLAWKIVAHGDYNGDGKADLLWRNDTTGQVYMMRMNGLAIAAQAMVYTEPNTAWKLMGPGTYAQ